MIQNRFVRYPLWHQHNQILVFRLGIQNLWTSWGVSVYNSDQPHTPWLMPRGLWTLQTQSPREQIVFQLGFRAHLKADNDVVHNELNCAFPKHQFTKTTTTTTTTYLPFDQKKHKTRVQIKTDKSDRKRQACLEATR